MKKLSLYGFMSVVSALIRQLWLPNPFECFGDISVIVNLIAEPCIQALSYAIVGLFYVKRSNPVIGCIAYLIVNFLVTGFLWLCGLFSFAWWWVVILLIALIGIVMFVIWALKRIDEKIDYCDYD